MLDTPQLSDLHIPQRELSACMHGVGDVVPAFTAFFASGLPNFLRFSFGWAKEPPREAWREKGLSRGWHINQPVLNGFRYRQLMRPLALRESGCGILLHRLQAHPFQIFFVAVSTSPSVFFGVVPPLPVACRKEPTGCCECLREPTPSGTEPPPIPPSSFLSVFSILLSIFSSCRSPCPRSFSSAVA